MEHPPISHHSELPAFRHTVLVLVSGVHRGVMPALAYARSIGGETRGVYVEIEPTTTSEVIARWRKHVPDIPLVVLESSHRSLVAPILEYVDAVGKERAGDIVTVIVPKLVTGRWWTGLLHGHSGFVLRWALRFRKRVVVTSVRYHLGGGPPDGADPPLTIPLEGNL